MRVVLILMGACSSDNSTKTLLFFSFSLILFFIRLIVQVLFQLTSHTFLIYCQFQPNVLRSWRTQWIPTTANWFSMLPLASVKRKQTRTEDTDTPINRCAERKKRPYQGKNTHKKNVHFIAIVPCPVVGWLFYSFHFHRFVNACFTLYSFYDINFVVNINFNLIFIASFLFQTGFLFTLLFVFSLSLSSGYALFGLCCNVKFMLSFCFIVWLGKCSFFVAFPILPISHSNSNIVNANISYLPRTFTLFVRLPVRTEPQ